MKKQIIISIISILILIILFFIFNKEKTIKIGFVSSLSTDLEQFGKDSLKGLDFGLSQEKYKVNNKNISLIIKDNKNNTDTHKKIINDFINNKDISIIIDNSNSSLVNESIKLTENRNDKILITSTANASSINKIYKKNFIRFSHNNSPYMFEPIANYLKNKNINQLCFLIGNTNKIYANDIQNIALKVFKKNTEFNLKFINIKDKKLNKFINNFNFNKHSAYFLILNYKNAAYITQFLKISNIEKEIFTHELLVTDLFLKQAGKSANKLTLISGDTNNKYLLDVTKETLADKKTPSIYIINSYKSSLLIINALKKCNPKDIACLKEKILNSNIKLFGKPIAFDKHNNLKVNYKLLKIENGNFIDLN